ncbi:MAG: AEC family transporter [Alphaproteobacteria bacterium]|nr:AEC family transporter [Alphaproteobacteria bacterium]MBU6472943.1 AEC family transporter [Alphaproteobacteria bacterium]MDE2011607.1 AEC family transporter [Alphaproteobacteria bacterium]MDE2071953.1 AEC family transporter [Alphaproteobacteria bacterium]MDE2351587.1 AEC family transporter [Alphaproteobacteria bacterium]
MTAVFGALLPTFLIIALAAGLHRARFLPEAAWDGMERATYFVFFPVFLFHTLADARFAGFHVWPLAFALLSSIAVMAGVLALLRKPLGVSGPQYSSLYQGAIRWNSFVAIATLQALYGATGITLAAVAFAAIVPVVNTLSVIALTRHSGANATTRTVTKSLARNPLILACAAGIAAQLVHLPIPGPIESTLSVLSEASIALGLFTVGAGLSFGGLKTRPRLIAAACALRLLLMPGLMLTFCLIYNVSGPARGVAIVAGAVPTATNSYILARQLGGDAPLMANIVTLTTILAFVTMPILVYLFA